MDTKFPQISSLTTVFMRKASVTQDVKETRAKHIEELQIIMSKYFEDVKAGKAEGIRSAKELIEVMKADLLLRGDPLMMNTTSNEDNNVGNSTAEEMKIAQISQILSVDDPNVKVLMQRMFKAVNTANDTIGSEQDNSDRNSDDQDNGLIADPTELDHAIALSMNNGESISSHEDIRAQVFDDKTTSDNTQTDTEDDIIDADIQEDLEDNEMNI